MPGSRASNTSQSLTPSGAVAGSCSNSNTVGRLQRPGAGCNAGTVNNTAWRLSSNRLLTDSQLGALISTAVLPNGARHSRNNAVHAGSSASSSKRKGSTGVVKLTP